MPPLQAATRATYIAFAVNGFSFASWASRIPAVKDRLDLSPNVPRLDSLGFPLVGGRLDYVGGRAIAAVVYARRQHVINVFSWPSREGIQAPRVVVSENGYHLMTWRTNGAEHWAASDVNVADLEQFVQLYTRSDDASKEP